MESVPEPVFGPPHESAPEPTFEYLRTFNSIEEAVASAREKAAVQGYSLAIHQRKTNPEGAVTSVRLRCSKGRKFTPHDTGTHPSKKRRTKSRKESCPFRLLIARDGERGWSIGPSPNPCARKHSHDPDSFGTFPADRGTIVKRHSAFILAQWNARVKIYQILAGLKHIGDPDAFLIKGQDISNFLKAQERASLGSQTSVK